VLTERSVVKLKENIFFSKLSCFIKHVEEGVKFKSIIFIRGLEL